MFVCLAKGNAVDLKSVNAEDLKKIREKGRIRYTIFKMTKKWCKGNILHGFWFP